MVGTGQVCVPVEYAAAYFAAVVLRQARRKGSTRDRSVVVVHCSLKGSARDRSAEVVCHFSIEGSTGDGAFVCHTARKGAARDRSDEVFHCSIEGSARDFSSVVVCHFLLKAAVLYGAFVCHTALEGSVRDLSCRGVCHCSIEGAFLDVAVVCHTALEGAVLNVAVVFHTALALEGTTADGAAVCHVSFKGAFLYGVQVFHTAIESAARDCSSRECSSGDVCHCSRKGAVASDGAAVCHTGREEAARDRPFVVCHVCSKVAAGNCRILFQFNLTAHSLLGNPSSIGFGIEVVEIIRSTFQNQCAALVLPAVARGAVRTDRIADRAHDELWEGVCCKSSQGEHGEHHAQCQDQAENAFFHRGRPPFLPKTASKSRTVVRFWIHHTIKTTGREAKPREMP